VTWVPGVAVLGFTDPVAPGGLVTAACARPYVADSRAIVPVAPELSKATLSPEKMANCLIRRMYVHPPKTA
jgi:hypothetical protein